MTGMGRLYRSPDSGVSWSPTTLREGRKCCLIADSVLGILALGSDTLFRSTDEGATWAQITGMPRTPKCMAVTGDGAVLVGGGTWGVYRWKVSDPVWTSSGLAGETIKAFIQNPWFGIVAATPNRIFCSSDGGTVWDTLAAAVFTSGYTCWIDSSGTLFAGGQVAGLKYSTDRGVSWKACGMNPDLTVSGIWSRRAGEMYASIVPIDPTLPGGVLKTTDAGATWKSLGLSEWGVPAMVHRGPGTIMVGTYRGVFRSTNDGATWIHSSDGISAVEVSAVLAIDSTRLLLGGSGTLFRSTTHGETWDESATGLTSTLVSSLAADRLANLFAGTLLFTPNGGIHKSTDGGLSWRRTSQDTVRGMYTSVQTLSVTSSGHILAAVEGTMYRSTDHGDTWRRVRSIASAKTIRGIALDSSGQVFAATNGDGMLRSTDEGATWLFTSANLPSPNLACLVTRSPGEVFVGSLKGVARTTNSGDTWIDVSGTSLQVSIRALTIDKQGAVLASTTKGKVYRTTDSGSSWTDVTNGLPGYQVSSFAVASRALIFAATDTAGLYRCNTVTLDVEPQPALVPSGLRLDQNYPNPFNPLTTIAYTVPIRSRVRLEVFNMLGQSVAVLVDADVEAGRHEVQFTAKHSASGVYVYCLRSGGLTLARGMVMLR